MIIMLRPAIVSIEYKYSSDGPSKHRKRINFTCVGHHLQKLEFESGESFVDARKISHDTMICSLDIISRENLDITPENIHEWNSIRYEPAFENDLGLVDRSFLSASFSVDQVEFEELIRFQYKNNLLRSISLELKNDIQDKDFNGVIVYRSWDADRKLWRNKTYEKKSLPISAMNLNFSHEHRFRND